MSKALSRTNVLHLKKDATWKNKKLNYFYLAWSKRFLQTAPPSPPYSPDALTPTKASTISFHRTIAAVKGYSVLWNILLRCVGLRNVLKVLQRESLIKRLHPREPFAYLWFIGVSPEVQQKGIGSVMLRQIQDHYDQKSLPVYLETSVDGNVCWYERAGFIMYDKLDLGFTLYCMKRAARLYTD